MGMTSLEPVHKPIRSVIGSRACRVAATAVTAGLVVLGTAAPAAATHPAAHPATRVTLTVASPDRGATVHDTTRVTFTGTNLRAVRIYRFTRLVATATVKSIARLASATIIDPPPELKSPSPPTPSSTTGASKVMIWVKRCRLEKAMTKLRR